jgi:predicted transcriptional regulator
MSSYHQIATRDLLSGLTVGRFMTPEPVTVSPDISLQSFVDHYLYRTHHQIYPVVQDGELVGCVTVKKRKNIPWEEWAQWHVADIAAGCEEAASISPDSQAMEALDMMNRTTSSRLMVVENGRLVGIVTLKDLSEMLALKMELEEPRRSV